MKTRIGLSLLLATLLGAFCLLTPHVSAGRTGANDARNYYCTYRVGDLPVWTKGGEFQSKVLLRHIETSIFPESWGGNGTSTVAADPQNASLVISTTRENHEKISDLLEKLR